LKPEGCPNGLGEHSALLAQAGVFSGFTENADNCRLFLEAEAGEAKVHQPPLVLIGGGCFTENADILSAFPWRASARWYSLATSCRRVAVSVC
jgi:hypothetical protein